MKIIFQSEWQTPDGAMLITVEAPEEWPDDLVERMANSLGQQFQARIEHGTDQPSWVEFGATSLRSDTVLTESYLNDADDALVDVLQEQPSSHMANGMPVLTRTRREHTIPRQAWREMLSNVALTLMGKALGDLTVPQWAVTREKAADKVFADANIPWGEPETLLLQTVNADG